MAGFGSISLTQTAAGSLLDQRAIVLYLDNDINVSQRPSDITSDLWGKMAGYQELFSGLLGDLGVLSTITNTTGTNPYGITYIDAKVNIESDVIEHPTETGGNLYETSIKVPITAEVTVAMPTFFAERIYNQIMKFYYDKNNMMVLQTKYGVYNRLVLKDVSYELKHDTIDRTEFVLSLREIQQVYDFFEDFNTDTIREAADSSTANTGSQVAMEE